MKTLMERAAKGERAALEELFERNWRMTTVICEGLLGDKDTAESVMLRAFYASWGILLSGGLSSEEDFQRALWKSAAGYCKSRVLKKDSKAFRTPVNRNFRVQPAADVPKDVPPLEKLFRTLPPSCRFLFVLREIAGFDEESIAAIIGMNNATLKIALDTQDSNVNAILGEGNDFSAREVAEELAKGLTLSEASRSRAMNGIDYYVQPYEEKARKKKITALIVLVAVVVVALIAAVVVNTGNTATSDGTVESEDADSSEDDNDAEEEGTSEDGEYTYTTEYTTDYYAYIEIEDYGTITVALDADAAPETVANFVSLAESGFYDGLTFHRIIEGFMMQGGDPNGDGTGGSEETITGEFMENGVENMLSHVRGAISMARSSDYDSASSQFFIVQEDSTYLDGSYAVFGYVIDGMDIVDAICEAAEPTDDNGTIEAKDQPVIVSITVEAVEEGI